MQAMRRAVIDQHDRCRDRERCVVEADGDHTAADTVGIVDDDVVGGGAMQENDAEARPVARNARIDP